MRLAELISGHRPEDLPSARSKNFVRENIEALTVAIVMALLIKHFAYEAFQVPTESMEPQIIGRPSGGDRLVVNKFAYMFRDPEPWEVVVFRYPLNTSMNYVKRCVGMPGEWVFIRNGDIWHADGSLDHDTALAKAAVRKKPANVLRHIFDHNPIIPPGERDVLHFDSYWIKDEGGKGQFIADREKNEVVFRSDAGPTLARFTRPKFQYQRPNPMGGEPIVGPLISNRRFDGWSPFADDGTVFGSILGKPSRPRGEGPPPGREEAVGDVRLKVSVRPEAKKGAFEFFLKDGCVEKPFTVRLAVEGGGQKSEFSDGLKTTSIPVTLSAESYTDIVVLNADDHFEVQVDGKTVLAVDYTHPPVEPGGGPIIGGGVTTPPGPTSAPAWPEQPLHKPAYATELKFGFSGGDCRMKNVDVARDIYYAFTPNGATDFHVPSDSYLCLGDNSPDSLDGRAWKESVMRYRENGKEVEWRGDAEAVSDSQRPFKNPYDDNTRFMDYLGNVKEIDPKGIISVETRFGHFVPRDMIMGRAYFAFWPILEWGVVR